MTKTNNIGKVLSDISNYCYDEEKARDEILIYQWISDDNYKESLLMEVWEIREDRNLGETFNPLLNQVYHTFIWRLEELLHDCKNEDDWDLVDTAEACDPMDLIDSFSDQTIEEVSDVVSSWVANDYAAMKLEAE